MVVLLSGHSNFHLLQRDKSRASLVLCAIPLSLKFHSSAVNVSMFKTIYIKNVNRVIFFFLFLITIFLFNFAKWIIIISIQSDNMKHMF